MKKITFVLLLTISASSLADGHHHGGGWVAPLIGGIAAGVVIGGIYNSRPVYSPPASVYYPPGYAGVPYGYHYESIYDQYCGCYKTVLAPNY